MTIIKNAVLVAVTAAAAIGAVAPASARPMHDHHRHQVCHMERHHGHHVRVCHWAR